MNSFSSFRKPDTNKSLGIEIECFLDYEETPFVGQRLGMFRTFYDGSIEVPFGKKGVEWVSEPLPAGWLKKEIYKLYSKKPWAQNYSCGIHIHVSRKWLSEKKAASIQNWYSELPDNMQNVLFGRESNYYCNRGKFDSAERYRAVNATPETTIEFRMFSSGDAKHAACCVDMAVWMVQNAHHLNIDAALAAIDLARATNK